MEPYILLLMLLIVLLALLITVGLLAGVCIARRNRLRTYEQLAQNTQAVGETSTCVPVRYASGERFAKWLKFFPWEHCGILCIGKDMATFYSKSSTQGDFSISFDPSTSQVSWLGRSLWRNGGLSWIVISRAGEMHYFSSETGMFIFGSATTTSELYEKLTQCLSTQAG